MLNRDDYSWPRRASISRSYFKYALLSDYKHWLYFTGEDPEYMRPEDYAFFEVYNCSLSPSEIQAKKLTRGS
ncbi:hypothetical protein [Thermosyntropha lipolytica]|uniref:hypothetical protein n=1 Tax=Thermosyntropha lipolytica TaxID=54294 RepID=UPI000933D1E4|nr:hypothetical protein [Thermosyntropha lipolytica]